MTTPREKFAALLDELTNAAMAEAYARETAGADAVNQCAARVATARAKAMTAYDTIANALRTAVDRLDDVLKGDDGQAWKEAERVMPNLLAVAGREGQPVAKVSADQLLDAIEQSIGIYPASFNGVPRTERQEGFNQAMREVLKVAAELQTRPASKTEPCPQCPPGAVCKTPTCGRLNAAHPAPKADAAADWVCVPREPTQAMIEAGRSSVTKLALGGATVRCWDAMLSAAPARVGEGAWKAVAEHIRHCVECGETDVMTCHEGRPLWEAAMSRESQG